MHMKTTSRPDLQIAGIGHAGGGDYYSVKMEGVCKVNGAIDCFTFTTSGMSTVEGGITASEQLEASGKFTCEGSVLSPAVKLEGHIHVHGSLCTEELQLGGYLKMKGSCETKKCKARGAFLVDGWLTGESIDLQLEGPGRAEGIRGGVISIKHVGSAKLLRVMKSLLPIWQARMNASLIEGDIIELEQTTAAVVRGRTVIIGPGCEIGRVEYSGDLIVHPLAQVGDRHQIAG
ncbi:hypothetical protein [Paenibacillus sp. R14(2021)]|uniref:hypothetical protein n=1 Tax=Paenibacillus sp. R14(2021) TaxID=2859228 RepID=UPI001C614155|nr:hypothetical protein [Paenibacillus sp. R14(2021)]